MGQNGGESGVPFIGIRVPPRADKVTNFIYGLVVASEPIKQDYLNT
jgi:hypothetical protein